MSSTYVHLRLHTEYSLVDGLVTIDALMATLNEMNATAVAVTDKSNLCALIKFYQKALKSGIKPIVGCDLWLSPESENASSTRLTLLAMNNEGYRNLARLISKGWCEGQHLDNIWVKRDWVASHAQGLLAISGAVEGDIAQALLADHLPEAEKLWQFWSNIFPQRLYLEVQRTKRPLDEQHIHKAAAFAQRVGAPLVATNDVRFLQMDDYEAHETRVCIAEGRQLTDQTRQSRFSPEQYLKSAEQMSALFADLPSALENSVQIAQRCTVELSLGKPCLPNFQVPDGQTEDSHLKHMASKGLEDRLAFTHGSSITQEDHFKYQERLSYELDTIAQMGFPGYFLIVMDFIRWAKQNGVPVGPGRGSGAGSLVAYVLGITDLDPLSYDLLFERFLNPERVSMPDFDIDFCMEGRDRVIEYVAQKYGRYAVGQIVTFGSMAAKAVVRDVARAQGKSYGLGDKLSKLIPFEVGMTLSKAFQQEASLRDFLSADEQGFEIWEMAIKLEGLVRNMGKHAGGVVIAPTELTDFTPILRDEDTGGLITQFDKDDVETAGLVKFDFLGLRTLTIIRWTLESVNAERVSRAENPLQIETLPLNDPKTFAMLQQGETTAVFQLESRGMKELIKKLKPDCLEDLIALVALFRPGPLQSGMVDDFINRKHGRAPVAYPHTQYQYDGLKPILSATYGIILYQEQVMQIAQVMAGFTLGQADLLRRAMGKKKADEMAKQRQAFIDGCQARNIDAQLSGNIFDLVEKFAGYGFNKSHSAAYGLLSYQTAWLKTHYPAQFMAAVLSADLNNTEKVLTLIEACRDMKLSIVPPDVNRSAWGFTVSVQGHLIYGLGAVKGVGESAVEDIVASRQQSLYRNLHDFCSKVDLKRVSRRTLDALIRSGAMDHIGPCDEEGKRLDVDLTRSILLASVDDAMRSAEQTRNNRDSGHVDLFGEMHAEEEFDGYAALMMIKPMSVSERLRYEKETLGYYLSAHPLDTYIDEIRQIAKPLDSIHASRNMQRIAGMLVQKRSMNSKKGERMLCVTLDDRTAKIEASWFVDALPEAENKLTADQPLVLEGELSTDDYNGGMRMRVRRVLSLSEARQAWLQNLCLIFHSDIHVPAIVQEVVDLLRKNQGSVTVSLMYETESSKVKLQTSELIKINPSDELIEQLNVKMGIKYLIQTYEPIKQSHTDGVYADRKKRPYRS